MTNSRMTNDERHDESEVPNASTICWMMHRTCREEPETKRVYGSWKNELSRAEAIIDFAKKNSTKCGNNGVIITQLVGARHLVLALSYVEEANAVSKKEYLKNIGHLPKEARESKHFLRMIVGQCRN